MKTRTAFIRNASVVMYVFLCSLLLFAIWKKGMVASQTIPLTLIRPVPVTGKIKIPIVMYHYVEFITDVNDTTRKRLNVFPPVFENHLRQLTGAHYTTYFARDIPRILDGEIAYSTRSAVLTFDDGYADFFTVVYPLLKKYNAKGTVYIITEFVGRKGFLTRDQIRELSQSGLVDIGSHTLTHPHLNKVAPLESKRQIESSKKILESIIGYPVQSFAYPYGSFNEVTPQQVEDAGYTTSVTVLPGVMQSRDDRFALFRIRPELFTESGIIQFIEGYNK